MYICAECKCINVDESRFDCMKCGACLGDERHHCHDKKNYDACIAFIEDCEDHFHGCSYGCHSECKCQNP